METVSSKPYDPLNNMSIDQYISLRVKEKMALEKIDDDIRKKEYNDKEAIKKKRHDDILASSRETIERNKKLLESTQNTLDKLKVTIDGCKETEQKFKDFQEAFGNIMSASLSKVFGGEDTEEMVKAHGAPRVSTIEEVAEKISEMSRIVILTGAGVSAESGVFTYKDNEDTWDIDGKSMTYQEIANVDILQGYPLEF